MPYENLNLLLNDDELAKIQTTLNELKETLPFLINLTTEERRRKGSLLRKSDYFRQVAFELGKQEPQLLPSAISLSQWENDMRLLQQLKPILNQVSQLQEGLQDTCMALQGELTQHALLFRNLLIEMSKQNIPGIDTMLQTLLKE